MAGDSSPYPGIRHLFLAPEGPERGRFAAPAAREPPCGPSRSCVSLCREPFADAGRGRSSPMSDSEETSSSYKAVAALPSVEAARRATEQLRQSGFTNERLSLSNESLAGLPEPERRARDAETGQRTRAATWTWALIGAVVRS